MHRVKQRPWLAVSVVAPRVAAERLDAPRVAAEGVVESVEKKNECGQQCFRDFDMLLHIPGLMMPILYHTFNSV